MSLPAANLDGAEAYRARLESDPAEWAVLTRLCRVTISRFWRDRALFEALRDDVLPRSAPRLSPGAPDAPRARSRTHSCSRRARPTSASAVLATDVDPVLLERARLARYPESSLRELPLELRRRAFEGDRLKRRHRARVEFAVHDVRTGAPDGPFDFVLCRNLVFTSFDEELQCELGAQLAASLRPGGVFVVGAHETLPDGLRELEPWPAYHGLYRRALSSGA